MAIKSIKQTVRTTMLMVSSHLLYAESPIRWWTQLIMGATARQAALGDVNGDGTIDAAWVQLQDPGLILLNDGDGNFAPHPTASPLPAAGVVAMGDLNGNGYLDLLIGIHLGQCQVWTNNGIGEFYFTGQLIGPNASRISITLTDINSNGFPDLIVALHQSSGSNNQNRIWLNNGSGMFTAGPTLSVARATVALAVADFTGNGFLDIVEGNTPTLPLPSLNPTNHLHVNLGGCNWSSIAALGGGHTAALGTGDLNGDGWPDIVVGNMNIPTTVSTAPINTDYERATYQTPAPPGGVEAFGRFRVEYEP